MNHLYKGKAKNILAWLSASLLILLTFYNTALGTRSFQFHIHLTADTIPEVKKTPVKMQLATDSVNILDTIPISKKDSLGSKPNADTSIVMVTDTISFKSSKDSLDAPVTYHADDSMIFDVPSKKLILYGTVSTVKYSDNELTAPQIEFDQKTNLVKAVLKKDSLGKVIAYPTFNQADFKSISDTIVFNMKNGKGITKGTYTQQGEMFVYGEKIKKINQDIFYALNGRFTTCNLDTPHFAFVSKKIKFINKKMAFTGPVHPEIEGVPLPIVLPFGIYPLSQGRHSGLIAPSFTSNQQLGLALEGLGYYKILSDNWDVVALGTLYSYGGWTAKVNPRYFRKYRYQGNFSLDMQKFKNGFKGDPDFSTTKTFNILWSHSADTKARPGVSFSANVNAGSSKFNSLVPNNPTRNFTNQLSSSITYAKVWKDKPYNISVSANHNQNTLQRLININFPDVSFNMNTQYPFRRKEAVGKIYWYENIGVGLNSNARSLTSFYDTAGNITRQITDNLQWGATHSVPISLSLPSLGPLQVAPSVSYQEKWYQEKFIRRWNSTTRKIDTSINKGFYTARDMSFGVGLSTRIFGSFTFGKKSKVQAIRHEIRPNLSISYKPDFNKQNFYETVIDTFGNKATYSVYDRSIFGSFSQGKFGGISFGFDNNIQMKVRNRKDTSEGAVKKVTLLDGLSITSRYNFLRDSFRLDVISLNARSSLFEKINITANATFDPYITNEQGRRIDKLIWTKKAATLGTLTNGGISLQSSFQGGDQTKKPNNQSVLNNDPSINANGYPLDEYQQEAAYISNNPGEFADFSIPWSIDFSYSLRFSRIPSSSNPGSFSTSLFQDVNWNSSANLTPKWKIGVTGSFNITEKKIGVLSMYLSRDMHCWQMAINIAPVGNFKFFTISISPKSALLRDLKVNRTRSFYDQ